MPRKGFFFRVSLFFEIHETIHTSSKKPIKTVSDLWNTKETPFFSFDIQENKISFLNWKKEEKKNWVAIYCSDLLDGICKKKWLADFFFFCNRYVCENMSTFSRPYFFFMAIFLRC